MKKLFISQPMKGKKDEEIKNERETAITRAKEIIGEDVDVLETFFNDFTSDAKPLQYLARSIEYLAMADIAYFAPGWEAARGCRIEHDCAVEYGIDRIEFETGRMNFGQAIEAVKRGNLIAREGWNGKGMFVVYQKGYPDGIPCNAQTANAWGMNEGDLFRCEPYLQIKMVNGSHAMWVPSINDVLAEDWIMVEKA